MRRRRNQNRINGDQRKVDRGKQAEIQRTIAAHAKEERIDVGHVHRRNQLVESVAAQRLGYIAGSQTGNSLRIGRHCHQFEGEQQ